MISVIIPLFNKQGSIKSTIESVLNQSYPDFELIVVNDGSSDSSKEIVEGFEDARVHIINKINGGVSSARNEGIRYSNGDWLAFLDGDDLWEPGFLAEVYKLTQKFPLSGIVGTSYYYDSRSNIVSCIKPFPKDFFGIVDNMLWDKAHIYCSSAVCCRKDALIDVGLFDERIAYGEDTDVWWRIMLKYPAAFSNKELAVYRFDEDNRAMNKRIPLEKLYINFFEKYTEDRKANDSFRHFIDKECMWWLQAYSADKLEKANVRRILSMIDLKEYKLSFRLRFMFPRLYRLIKNI